MCLATQGIALESSHCSSVSRHLSILLWSLSVCTKATLLHRDCCNAMRIKHLLLLQVISAHKKWVIHRGESVSDGILVATIKKERWSMHSGVEVKLAGGHKAEYTLRQQGLIAGRREIVIMHHNRVIGRVSKASSRPCNNAAVVTIAQHNSS